MNELHLQYRTVEASKTLAFACAFVLLLHYCYALLSSCPLYNLNTLQKVQNSWVKLHGFRKKYTTNCQLSVNNFSDSFCVHPFLADLFFCRLRILHIPMLKSKPLANAFSLIVCFKAPVPFIFYMLSKLFFLLGNPAFDNFLIKQPSYVFIHTDWNRTWSENWHQKTQERLYAANWYRNTGVVEYQDNPRPSSVFTLAAQAPKGLSLGEVGIWLSVLHFKFYLLRILYDKLAPYQVSKKWVILSNGTKELVNDDSSNYRCIDIHGCSSRVFKLEDTVNWATSIKLCILLLIYRPCDVAVGACKLLLDNIRGLTQRALHQGTFQHWQK